jgi:hypothetical protein
VSEEIEAFAGSGDVAFWNDPDEPFLEREKRDSQDGFLGRVSTGAAGLLVKIISTGH